MIPLTIRLESDPVTAINPTDSRGILNAYRADLGMGRVTSRVNMLKANGKLSLDTGSNIAVFGLSLNPADTHGDINTCVWSTDGCREACILNAAYQRSDNVVNSRRALTNYLFAEPNVFISHLAWEIEELLAKYGDGNVAIRLNVASDLRWEIIAPVLFDTYGQRVKFYDYTKAPFDQRVFRDDYTLVYSVSERASSKANARKFIEAGHSATIVIDLGYTSHDNMAAIPDELDGIADHDIHDLRTLDKGKLGLLRAKANARGGGNDFVRTVSEARDIMGG